MQQVENQVQHDLASFQNQSLPALPTRPGLDLSDRDNQALLSRQEQQQLHQDQEIGQLIKTVGNIKNLGKTIGGELSTDLKILEETEKGTDRNLSKMKRA